MVEEKLSFGDKISEVKIDANPMPRKRIFDSLSFNKAWYPFFSNKIYSQISKKYASRT